MEFKENHGESGSDITDSDWGLNSEAEIRMRSKFYEVTDTREGQSVMVPGISAAKAPGESLSQPFISYKTYSSDTSVPESELARKPTVPTSKSPATGTPVQVLERGEQTSVHVFPSVQTERYSYDPTDETSPLLDKRQKLKCTFCVYTKVSICVSLLLIAGLLMISCMAAILGSISTVPGPIITNIIIDNEDMVLLDFYDTYEYDGITVQKSNDDLCPHCQVEVYSFYPDYLIVTDNDFNTTTPQITATYDGVLLTPHYLLSASYIDLSILFFPTQAQNTSIEILLFDDLKKYLPFQKAKKPSAHQVFQLQVNEMETNYMHRIKIEVTGYYFIGIRPSHSPITFQSSIFVHQIEYSRADFPPPSCVLTSTKPCTVPFKRSYTDTYTDTLKTTVLVYSIPPPEVSNSYFVELNYEVSRGFWTASSITLLSIICVLSLCVAVMCAYWVYLCTCLIRRRNNKQKYVNIN